MVPILTKTVYNEFTPDQVLTSDNLNDLFNYLDEANRLSRTLLIGTGIACGFHMKTTTDAGGTRILITKGAGITTEGYLVAMPDVTYQHRTTSVFNAVQCAYYTRFVDTAHGNSQKFDLWELKEADDGSKTTPLTESFLTDGNKIVLLFVELLEENNKNCDPSSCDDKGKKITVSIKALLAKEQAVIDFLSNSSNAIVSGKAVLLPEIKMPRYNAATPAMMNAADILQRYRNILSSSFIGSVQSKLTGVFGRLQSILQNDFAGDEFNLLAANFAFLSSGTISTNDILRLQYYYDFFSNLLLAYDELKQAAAEMVCECVPDADRFPRHLLIGEAMGFNEGTSIYRTRFIPAAGVSCCAGGEAVIKFLYRRLVLMVQRLNMTNDDDGIKITPSLFGASPLSQKAIPYYFNAAGGNPQLYKTWNYEKTLHNEANQVLSYKASAYAAGSDTFVTDPLSFDIEPYNFFRVEGVVGKNVAAALEAVKNKITGAALPFKVLALATGEPRPGSSDGDCCSFSDIKLQYQLLRTTLICCFKGHITYWGSIEKKDDGTGHYVLATAALLYSNIYNVATARLVTLEPQVYMSSDYTLATHTGEATVMRSGTAADLSKSAKAAPAAARIDRTSVRRENVARTGNTGMMIGSNAGVASNAANAASYGAGVMEYHLYEPSNQDAVMYSYNQYQHLWGNLHTIPVPTNSSPADNISHYMLILIDELNSLSAIASTEDIENFDEAGFNTHVDRLKDAHGKLLEYVAGFHSKAYLVAKMKATLSTHTASIQTIADNMKIMNDDDASKITYTLYNATPALETSYVNRIVSAKSSYSDQRAVIQKQYDIDIKDDGNTFPRNVEPTETVSSEYNSMLEQLKKGICFCEIDNLKFLINKYKTQVSVQQDYENFSVFIKKHPGLQPKAGVATGGTYIMVYTGAADTTVAGVGANIVIGDFYLPYICSSNCTPIEITIVQPSPPNIPPVARPGDNVSVQLPSNSVTLDGSTSSDPDGSVVSYLWEQSEGTAVTIPAGGTVATVTITGLTAGVYKFKLTVTDNNGTPNSAFVTVTVLAAPNVPPVAVATVNKANITLPENSVRLDGSASSDPDGAVASHEWTLATGPANGAVINPPVNTPAVTATFTKPGTYTFQLTVKDDKGAPATATVTVVVNPSVNQPPVAEVSVDNNNLVIINENAVAMLNGESSNDDVAIASYLWTVVPDNGNVHISSPDNKNTSVEFSEAGDYTFTLTVTDNEGVPGTASIAISVARQELPQVNLCGELSEILARFESFDTNQLSNVLKDNLEYRAVYGDIKRFYTTMKLQAIAAKPEADQINFFVIQKLSTRLPKWIERLAQFITKENTRLAALLMLMVHAQLAYYAACISGKDANAGDLQMEAALKAIFNLMEAIRTGMNNSNSDDEKKAVKQLRKITQDARNAVVNKGEQGTKQFYFSLLNDILNALRTIIG